MIFKVNSKDLKKNYSQLNDNKSWLQKEIQDIKEMWKNIKEDDYKLSLKI